MRRAGILLSGRSLVLAVAILAVLASGCARKYEEDERRFMQTPCGRIARKWVVTSVVRGGREITDSVIFFDNRSRSGALISRDSFVYRDLILELERSDNRFCLETGIVGRAVVLNRPFSSGYYELSNKRFFLRFDVKPGDSTNARYLFDLYSIIKLTREDMIISGRERVTLRAL